MINRDNGQLGRWPIGNVTSRNRGQLER